MRTNGFIWLALSCGPALVRACGGHDHDHPVRKWSQEELDELERKWGAEFGFTGITTFAHLQYYKCLTTPSEPFDIGIIGAPFDTAVSYRPGARFGPRAIRAASARQTSFRGFNARAGFNPYQSWARILDCGDIPVSPFDNAVAIQQMTAALTELGGRAPAVASDDGGEGSAPSPPPAWWPKPKLITLGGDHSLSLPALRALNAVYGQPIRVLHFDAHLDTWHPNKYPSHWASEQASFNHGSMFWLAGREGLIVGGTGPNATRGSGTKEDTRPSVHAGLRTRLSGSDFGDYEDDTAQNWVRIEADEVDDPDAAAGRGGVRGVTARILEALGTEDPVYLSVDIDVLDPAFAPGTGTPEPGGWTTRELIRVLRGLEGLNVVGADVVEVAPAYQGPGEETALAAAQVVYELLTSMVKRGVRDRERAPAALGAGEKIGKGGRDEL
ncbi:Arginase/deacetylase [Durotheca rogersii]|uniref:Arginase/deacetylase n=1 Tax=Durotheca rogersii TaxID=419775 RepID=UPI00222042C2|nr:Arginase/deacetylase [Durotheca rogersii]KAI5863079.1 Arginase/deacetylase [Durotheca rogersii]